MTPHRSYLNVQVLDGFLDGALDGALDGEWDVFGLCVPMYVMMILRGDMTAKEGVIIGWRVAADSETDDKSC